MRCFQEMTRLASIALISVIYSTQLFALPACGDLDPSTFTQEQISSAAATPFEILEEPWGQDFAEFVTLTAENLGCEPDNFFEALIPLFFDGFEQTLSEEVLQSIESFQLSAAQDPIDSYCNRRFHSSFDPIACRQALCPCNATAQKTYCDCVAYCGDGDSSSLSNGTTPQLLAGSLIRASDTLNKLCFEHDRCYGRSCQSGLGCVFNTQNETIKGCDLGMDSYCSSSSKPIVDGIICAAVGFLHITSNAFDCTLSEQGDYCPPGTECLSDGERCVDPNDLLSVPGWDATSCYRTTGQNGGSGPGSPECALAFTSFEACRAFQESHREQGAYYNVQAGTIDCEPWSICREHSFDGFTQKNRGSLGNYLLIDVPRPYLDTTCECTKYWPRC